MKITLRNSVLLILVVFCPAISLRSNTVNVANPGNNNDILPNMEKAVNLAADGDLIVLPEGIFVFSDQLEIRKKISLRGAGLSKTILYRPNSLSDNKLNYRPMIKFVVYSDNPCGIVVSGICFRSKTDNTSIALDHGLEMQQAVDFVIHDCRFEYFGEAGIYILHKDNLARGVIYNCQFYHNYKSDGLGYGYGVTVQGENSSWVSSPKFGTSNFIFIEDNSFEFHRHAIVSGEGGLYVARYNTITNNLIGNAIDMHEARNETSFASRAGEIYNNNIKNTLFANGTPLIQGQGTTYLANTAICIRGGEAIIYNNATEGFRYGLQIAAAWYLEGPYPIRGQTGYRSGLTYGINDTDPSHSDGDLFAWNNKHTVYQTANPYPYFVNEHPSYLKENRDYHFTAKPGYSPFTYPHPLRNSSSVSVTTITVAGSNTGNITSNGGSLQMTATVLPQNATNPRVNWSITSGSDLATISSDGIIKAFKNGNITIKATAQDGSGVSGSKIVAISGQLVKVSAITVNGINNVSSISANKGVLQMQIVVTPSDASRDVIWSISSGADFAGISTTGLVTALKNGSVTIKATAKDGSGISGSKIITVSGQNVNVASVAVKGINNASTISIYKGTLQMQAIVGPSDATNKTVAWSIASGSSYATISPSGLLSALANGTVTVKSTAKDGSGKYGTMNLSISGQSIPVTTITVNGLNNISSITKDKSTLQMLALVSPSNATNKGVSWSIVSGSALATISSSGLLSALKNGSVTVKAAAGDGSGKYGTKVVTLSGQTVKVTSVSLKGYNNVSSITKDKGTLQMQVLGTPSDATNKSINWSIVSGTSLASISSSGLLSALKNGSVTVKAATRDGSGKYATKIITIAGQTVKVTSIFVKGNNNISSITKDKGILQMLVLVSPSDATNKGVSWSIVSGSSLATISSGGLLSALNNGSVTVKAAAQDGSGKYVTKTIAISGQITKVFSLADKSTDIDFFDTSEGKIAIEDNGQNMIDEDENFRIYPNPAKEEIYLQTSLKDVKGLLKVYSLTGVLLKEVEFADASINIDFLKTGYYFLVFQINGKMYKKKLQVN